MRCLLTGPKALETRNDWFGTVQFGDLVAEQSRGGLLFLIAESVGNFASQIQVTHICTGLHGAVGHRRLQEYRISFKREGEDGSTVVFTSCTDFRKAVDECARIDCRSTPGGKAEDVDPKYIKTKAACSSCT